MKPSPALGMRHPDLNILQMLDYQGKYLASIKSDEARKKQIPRSSEGGDKTHPYRVLQALPLVSSQPMTIFLELLTSLTNYEPIGSQEISSAPSFRYHTYRQEMAMLQQSNSEISLHHSNTYLFAFPNGPFQRAKWTFSRPKTVRFRTQKGMYCNPLKINIVQRWRNRRCNLNFLDNLLPVSNCCSMRLLNNTD